MAQPARLANRSVVAPIAGAPAVRSVVQADLAPGVRVTIDPALVPDAERILRALRAALASLK